MIDTSNALPPHAGGRLLTAGAPLASARAAMIMVHGRGATAHDILSLAPLLLERDVAYIAPQAGQQTWYPLSFLSPIPANEPGISSGISVLNVLVGKLDDAGIPSERVLLLGFSQGACLSLEFVARHARRYGGVAGLSGGLIGPPETPREYAGSLYGTPVVLGCSDVDPHIPEWRVHESADVLERLGASVTTRIYPGMAHTVNDDELEAVREMIRGVL